MKDIGQIVKTINNVGTVISSLTSAFNQSRSIANNTKSIELAQKREEDNYQLGLKRMEFDAKMEIARQAIKAKERHEDKEFSLQLKAIEAENWLKQEKMRQVYQSLEAEKQREFTEAIEKYKAEVQIALQSDNIAFQRWKTESDRQFTLEIRTLDAQIARQRDKQNRDDARRDRNNPFFTVADDTLQIVHNRPEMPLTVFFSPPVLRYDPLPNATAQSQFPMMESTLSGALREMFKQYTLKQRPIKFMAGEWVTKNRRAESAVNQIFSELNSIPVLVLETEVEESFFNINIGFWNNDFDDARFETVVRKFRWQDLIAELSQNLLKQWQDQGRQIQTDSDKGEFIRRSRENFTHYMEILHCIHVGMATDEYFLIYAPNRQLPLLPSLLPDLFEDANLPDDERVALTKAVIDYCNALFDGLEQSEPGVMVDLRIGWAKILQEMPSRYGFETQVQAIMQTWLKQRLGRHGGTAPTDILTDIGKMLLPADQDFVQSLNGFLQVLGESRYLNIAGSCYQRGSEYFQTQRYDLAIVDFNRAIFLNPHVDAYFQRAIAYFYQENYQQAIADLEQAIKIQQNRAEFYEWRAITYYRLGEYEKAILDYDSVLRINPNHAKAQQNKQNALGALHERERQKETLKAEQERQRQEAIKAEEERKKREEEAREAEQERQRQEAIKAEEERQRQEEARKKEQEPLNQAKAKYPELDQLLADKEWKKADQKTTEIMLKISGRESRGYLDDDSCKNFPPQELKMIDLLWVHHSQGQFGFSVQKEIWTSAKIGGKVGEYDYGKFCLLGDEVGWRKGCEWMSYDSLAFSTSIGHLPGGGGGSRGGEWVWFRGKYGGGKGYFFLLCKL